MTKKTLPIAFEAAASLMEDHHFSEQLYREMIEQMVDDYETVARKQRPEALGILQDALYQVAGSDPVIGCLVALHTHNRIPDIQQYTADTIMQTSLVTMSAVDDSSALKMALMIYATSPEGSPGEKMAREKIPGLAITYALLSDSAIEARRIIREALEGRKGEEHYKSLIETCQKELLLYCPYVGSSPRRHPAGLAPD